MVCPGCNLTINLQHPDFNDNLKSFLCDDSPFEDMTHTARLSLLVMGPVLKYYTKLRIIQNFPSTLASSPIYIGCSDHTMAYERQESNDNTHYYESLPGNNSLYSRSVKTMRTVVMEKLPVVAGTIFYTALVSSVVFVFVMFAIQIKE